MMQFLHLKNVKERELDNSLQELGEDKESFFLGKSEKEHLGKLKM